MKYTLMHKNVPVADMTIDETGYIANCEQLTTAAACRPVSPL